MPDINTQRGFTLIELMVTISIVVLVTGIALVRYSTFNSTVLLNTESFKVALDIRRAQAYGLSASGFGGDFRDPYGIYFDLSKRGQYIFFQDGNRDGLYQTSEKLETITIEPRFELGSLCTDGTCRNGNNAKLTIWFERPNFVANFWSNFSSKPSEAEIKLVETKGNDPATRSIVVESTGYISVQQ